MSEPLASPTLALLYLAQGHRARARATLEEVLALDPDNGYALALRQRMRARPRIQLGARFVATSTAGIGLGAGELELRWTIPADLIPPDHRAYVVVAFATRDRASLRFTSILCLGRSGSSTIPAPLGPASAAITLVASKPESPLQILAVTDPANW